MCNRNVFWRSVAGLSLVLAAGIRADEVVLKNGSRFRGEIIEETPKGVTLKISSGVVTLEAKSIKSVRRDAGTAAFAASAPSSVPAPPPPPDRVVKVGPGGIGKAELDRYLLKRANRLNRAVGDLTPEERRQVLAEAIDDETVFQAALADGMLNDAYIRSRIVGEFRSSRTTAKIEPRSFSDEELEKYYDAHPEEFTDPAEVDVEICEFPLGTTEAEAEAGRTKPESLAWRSGGWVKKGDNALFAVMGLAEVIELPAGGVTKVLKNGGRFVLARVRERKDPVRKPFAECRARARFLLIGEKQQGLDAGLRKELAGAEGAGSDEENLFRAALAAGVARNPLIRLRIINDYLAKLGVNPTLKETKKREDVLPDLRKRFPAEILDPGAVEGKPAGAPERHEPDGGGVE
ncbi:MAG: peptidylprolyl isomerase [Planctomycetota bacterium]